VTPVPVSGGGRLAQLARSAAGPVACAVVLAGLLSAWVATGGAGTLTRVRVQVLSAVVPMRAYTRQAADAIGSADTFLTIRNLSASPDELVAVRSPVAARVVLTQRVLPGGPWSVVNSLTIPGHGTVSLSPFGDDVVLEHPAPYEASKDVPLTLVFRTAGTVTIDATVTGPGVP
jgi:copper(I)-binding protein